jgi:DNA repair protein RadC
LPAARSAGAEGHRSRLRERFSVAGLSGFHDYEILELLLTFAIPRRDMKPVAKTLIAQFGSLRGVFEASAEQLRQVKGVGPNAAILLRLLKETASLYLKAKVTTGPVLDSPGAILDYCRHALQGQRNEMFQAVFLSPKHEALAIETISEGTVDWSAVYPRKVLEAAIRHNAVAVIFVHNHPGGRAEASDGDRRLTEALAQAASAIGVRVHDHLIIGQNDWLSFREQGWLPT